MANTTHIKVVTTTTFGTVYTALLEVTGPSGVVHVPVGVFTCQAAMHAAVEQATELVHALVEIAQPL